DQDLLELGGGEALVGERARLDAGHVLAEHDRAGRYVRVLPASEIEDLAYVRTTCTWQGQPFIVLGEHDAWLRVEYTGGRWPVAEAMRLEVFDFGVYQGWAPAAEVTDLREQRV
ncbi:hypothetical protein ABZ749_03420, partial [Micromonospora sp. NPDC047753]|uniref:hypothetical protein n=1 Tax=Micromonospora sp. NPDC047753 TaxID=3154817 RepID=UPI0033FAE499